MVVVRLAAARPDEIVEYRGEEFVTQTRRSEIVDWFTSTGAELPAAPQIFEKHDVWLLTSMPFRLRTRFRFAERYDMKVKGLFTARR